jgi:phosphoglycolate phosphatase-like HAD superfamily hydrolase
MEESVSNKRWDRYIDQISGKIPEKPFRHALFDFDGTLSLIRQGWQDVMISYFTAELAASPRGESTKAIENKVRSFVTDLTGKQTIYQCIQLSEEIKKRGGTPKDPLFYKKEYLFRLDNAIKERMDALKSKSISPESLLLPGSREFLSALQESSVFLHVASGTDLCYVEMEIDYLELSSFFTGRIFGALDDYKSFSKKETISSILKNNNIPASQLLIVGDGYVEIEDGNNAGCYTVGVACDEANPGQIDEWKRQRLIKAGADIIISDYSKTDILMRFLFSK